MSDADTTSRVDDKQLTFVGWMLWNIVRAEHVSRGTVWPWDGIFEDMPQDQQTAWNRAAADLQQRAKSFGRLI
jgi:hypothetical protein